MLENGLVKLFFKFSCYTSTKKEVKQTSFFVNCHLSFQMFTLLLDPKKELIKPMVACSFLGVRVALISFLGAMVRIILSTG